MDAVGDTGPPAGPPASQDAAQALSLPARLERWVRRLLARILHWLRGIPCRNWKRLRNLLERLGEWLGKAQLDSPGWWARFVVIAAIVGFALFGVLDALPWWVGVALILVGLVAISTSVVARVGHAIGAVIAGIVALAGVNWVVDKLFSWLGFSMPIVPGLLFAVFVFALAARRYLLFAKWAGPSVAEVALSLAVVVILGLPLAVGLATREGSKHVPAPSSTAPKVDVLIITSGKGDQRSLPALAGEPTLSGFDVRYSIGVAVGNRVRWTLSEDEAPHDALEALAQGAAAPSVARPKLRAGASAVVLLDVDGTVPVASRPEALPNVTAGSDEVSRWRGIAAAATPVGSGPVPTFALLQSDSPQRIGSWQRFIPKGVVLSRQAQTQTSLTAIGVAMAVGAPSADADYALALRYRPILLFDSAEAVPRPLSVSWLFDKGRVKLCKDDGLKTDCVAADSPAQLKSGGTHLGLNLPSSAELKRLARQDRKRLGLDSGAVGEPSAPAAAPHAAGAAPLGAQELVSPSVAKAASPSTPKPVSARTPKLIAGGPDTAIYVHPVADERDGRQLLYLDYWWYLSDNPSGVGGGAFCGAGLVIPGITCENHVSDWEGMTVVVDRTGARPFVASIHYAEHKDVVGYGWTELRSMWANDKAVPRFVHDVPGYAERPLAFIASGTHAAYASPCASKCRQIASDLGEDDRDGELPWIGDYTATCGVTSCVQVLPTYEAGLHPALWNAFAGTWGDRHCVFKYYCDLTTPPVAPGEQARYEHPSRCTGIVGRSGKFKAEPCEP